MADAQRAVVPPLAGLPHDSLLGRSTQATSEASVQLATQASRSSATRAIDTSPVGMAEWPI